MSSKIGDDEMKTSAFWGGLGGNLFQAAGKGVDKVFKGKTGRAREEAYAADQVKYIEHRGRQFAGLQKELAAADQANDPARRTIALNEMMMAMALDAVAMGKFDEHIESLQNMTELTPEEAAKYKDEHGVELNVDLFKQSVPEMIKLSEKVREKQLKYQDKYDSDISASLTRNDMNMEMFQNRIDELSKNESTLMQKTPGANLIGEKSKAIAHYQRTMLVHKELVKSLNKKLTESKSDLRSKELKKAIAREESNVVEAEKNIKKSKEIKETLTTEEKANNDKGVKANKAISEELAQSMFERVSLEDAILRGYSENEFLKSKAYGSRKKKEDIRRAVEGIINDKQASDAKKVIEENPDFTRAEKDVLIEKIDNKLIEIEKFKSDKLEKEKKANEEDEIIKEKQEEAKNNPEKIPNNNIAPVLDNYEDPHADEETPLDQLLEEDDNTEELKADEAKTMKLLDEVEGTERFQAWSANGLNKEGVEVEFVVGEGMSEDNKTAIADFNAGNITQHTYDYYPIKVLVNAGVEGVYSYLPTRTEKNTNFDTNELPQRKIIVDQLSSGKKVTSVVSRTTGGGLLTEEGDPSSPAPPANNILELSEYLNMDASDVQVLLTNEDGQFFDVNKDLYMPLAGRQLLVSGVEDPVSYKGGVFVMITKANGDKFPLRVNLSKHSSIEADTIADLLIEMAVKKSIKGGTRLSQLSEELQALVKSNDPKALEALGKEPSVSEIINLLTYVTKATAGLESELYMKGNTIRFANGRVISAENIEEGREDLVDFLLNKKRKQFNLNLWNKSDAYKQYIIETKTISTNAKTGSIPFGNDNNGRKVSVYIERVKGDPAEVNPISSEGVNTNNPDLSNTGSKELDDRIALSTSSVKESSGEQKRDGKFVGSYYYPKGSAMYAAGARDLVIGRDTAEEVQKALNEKYYAEARKVKAKPAPKKKKDIENSKTVAQLKDEAKSKGIRGYSKMNKAQLKEALDELKNTESKTSSVEELRKQEQLELIKSIPNADKYLTDGKVDKEKITNPEDVAKFEKIYDKYDKLISPLMGEKTTPTTQQTSEVDVNNIDYVDSTLYNENVNKTSEGTKFINVYRAEGEVVNKENLPLAVRGNAGSWFTPSKTEVARYAAMNNRTVYKIAIPKSLYDNLLKSRKGEVAMSKGEIQLPQNISSLKTEISKPAQQTNGVAVKEVANGVKIIDNALTSSEEAEIFQMIKPFLESQGSRSNKSKAAPIMIGMGLRWDYKSNNPGKSPVEIKETIVNSQGQRNKYAYYDVSIDGEALGAIPTRLKELMTKATGIDASNYDGAIINIYPKNGFISAHNDVDESVTAINYPVIVANIGGAGSLSIEGAESQKARKGYSSKEYVNEPLSSGSAYIFGEDGKNRNVFHRTLPSSGKGNLPQLNVKGQIIPANSYRISVTLRRVKDLEPGMPTTPNKPSQQTNDQTSLNFDENSLNLKSSIETDLSNDLEAANMIRKEPVKKAEEKTNSQSLGSKEPFVAEVFGEKTTRLTRKEIEAEIMTPKTGCK